MKRCEITRFPECAYPLQEGYNTLVTNLAFAGKEFKRILITSCDASEGKTLTSMNLMRTLANLDHTVIMVDLDLRRSHIASRFGLRLPEGEPTGVAHYLAGMCGINDAVYETDIKNAYIAPVGRLVKNSLQLISGSKIGTFMDILAGSFDYVIVDAPPIGVIVDAAQIAKYCDGSLLVVRHNAVTGKLLSETYTQLENTGCPVLGAVLNDVELSTRSGRYYKKRMYYA